MQEHINLKPLSYTSVCVVNQVQQGIIRFAHVIDIYMYTPLLPIVS